MARISKKNKGVAGTLSYDDFLDSQIRDDPEFTAEYLNAAIEDEDPRAFLTALSNVARADGVSKIAEQTNPGRESLYKSLSGNREPRFTSIEAILDAAGFKLRVEPKTAA